MTSTERPGPSAVVAADRPRGLHPYVRILLTMLAVGAAGFAIGGLTSPAQEFLPDAVSSGANSASGWTLATVLLVASSRLRPLPAAYAGSLAMVLMVEGYGVVSTLRGFPNGPPLEGLFTIAGLFAGFLTGGATALLRDGSPVFRALAIVPLAVVLLGEGIYGLTVVADTTSPVYWSTMIVLAWCFLGWQLIRQRPRFLLTASVLVLIALGAGAFWVLYAQPLTLLF